MAKRWWAARIVVASVLVALACTAAGMGGVNAATCIASIANNKVYVLVEARSLGAAQNAVDAVKGKVDKRLDMLNTVGAWVTQRSAADLVTQPDVLYVSPSTAVRFQADPVVPREATAVYPSVIGAPALWAKGQAGGRVGVAVI